MPLLILSSGMTHIGYVIEKTTFDVFFMCSVPGSVWVLFPPFVAGPARKNATTNKKKSQNDRLLFICVLRVPVYAAYIHARCQRDRTVLQTISTASVEVLNTIGTKKKHFVQAHADRASYNLCEVTFRRTWGPLL